MDNSAIYENIMMNRYFNRLKAIRNDWDGKIENAYGLATIIDIGGAGYRSYNFIMDQCNSIISEMIPYLAIELLKAYKITVHRYPIRRNDAHVYSVSKNKNWPDYVEQSNSQTVFAFSCEDKSHKDILYIFKELGIGNYLPKSLLNTIMKENDLKHYCYISVVEKEVINHNDDENDLSSGTGIFSIKQFFDSFFGTDEYSVFKKYAGEFTRKVKDYFGFEIVRTLKPNTLHNFRKTVRDELAGCVIENLDKDGRLSIKQRKIVDGHFFEEKNYEIMTGTGDFAQSYMTAEWLYNSLTEAGNIDLTAIAMGYFKAIEQLLFQFIKLHTKEKDGVSRRIYVGKLGRLDLTDSLLSDKDKIKDINLGSLTKFFGSCNTDRNRYWYRNKDLLVDGIDNATYEYIIDVLSGIVGLRNGFFHKHNLEKWDKVVDARNGARLVFYLLLGAYKVSDDDKQLLGLIQTNAHDDYYRLCEYLNRSAGSTNGWDIPIFYMNGETNPDDFWWGYQDDFIEYDNYGEPIYSGVYFRKDNQYIQKETRETLPTEIWEGVLNIKNLKNFKPSGPLKKIYKDGEFFGG